MGMSPTSFGDEGDGESLTVLKEADVVEVTGDEFGRGVNTRLDVGPAGNYQFGGVAVARAIAFCSGPVADGDGRVGQLNVGVIEEHTKGGIVAGCVSPEGVNVDHIVSVSVDAPLRVDLGVRR